MYERDSQTLGREAEALRTAAVAKGWAWTAGQAARLNTSPEEILEAIKRGWLPTDIERIENRYALESDPTFSPIRFTVISEPSAAGAQRAKVNNKARDSKENTARHRKRLRSEKPWADKKSDGASVMELAFMRAAE